jgi:hypothetical protein
VRHGPMGAKQFWFRFTNHCKSMPCEDGVSDYKRI